MSTPSPELFIPIDSALVSRNLMTRARHRVTRIVEDTVYETRLPGAGTGKTDKKQQTGIDLIGKHEYAKARLSDPTLAMFSLRRVVSRFGERLRNDSMNAHITAIPMGDAGHARVAEGLFIVGFKTDKTFQKHFSEERERAIGTVQAITKTPLEAGSFEQLATADGDPLWLPVLRVITADPAAEQMLEAFTGYLTEKTDNMTVDVYEATPALGTVKLPMVTPETVPTATAATPPFIHG